MNKDDANDDDDDEEDGVSTDDELIRLPPRPRVPPPRYRPAAPGDESQQAQEIPAWSPPSPPSSYEDKADRLIAWLCRRH